MVLSELANQLAKRGHRRDGCCPLNWGDASKEAETIMVICKNETSSAGALKIWILTQETRKHDYFFVV